MCCIWLMICTSYWSALVPEVLLMIAVSSYPCSTNLNQVCNGILTADIKGTPAAQTPRWRFLELHLAVHHTCVTCKQLERKEMLIIMNLTLISKSSILVLTASSNVSCDDGVDMQVRSGSIMGQCKPAADAISPGISFSWEACRIDYGLQVYGVQL
jgi:hypothetical protein